MQYLAIFGQNKWLSLAEILAVYPKTNVSTMSDGAAILDLAEEIQLERLGGTPKLAQILNEKPVSVDEAKKIIIRDLLDNFSGKKIFFGLSFYGNENRKLYERLGKEIKKELQLADESARWVSSREIALSSVIVKTNKLLTRGADYCLLFTNGNACVARTVSVQDFYDYERRDIGRPARDLYSGMTPPKLAKMLINLGGPASPSLGGKSEEILDPFCGSGTFLSEAALLGYKKIYGSDISEKAIADSKENLEWLKKIYSFSAEAEIKACDVKNLAKCWSKKFKLIVTEPYLGPAVRGELSETQAKKLQTDLEKLYDGYLAGLSAVLEKDGRAILIVPFPIANKKFFKLNLELKKNGFSAVPPLPASIYSAGSIDYSRPDQKIGREIYILKKF